MGPRPPFDEPIDVSILFGMKQPDRFRKRKFPDVKNDLDNLSKAVLDALNKQVWIDDGRIVRLVLRKKWSPQGYVSVVVKRAETDGI